MEHIKSRLRQKSGLEGICGRRKEGVNSKKEGGFDPAFFFKKDASL